MTRERISHTPPLTRRGLIRAGAMGAGGLLLSGCDKLYANPGFRATLESAEQWHQATQRWLGGGALAREYAPSDMSPVFRSNGNRSVADPFYQRLLKQNFERWVLTVDGLVQRPLALSLASLRAMPQRTQITRHDCVEGWSAIGKWQGPQLKHVLDMARLQDKARYIVFHCADSFGASRYYESIDRADAFHPQTILAWRMNDRPLDEAHGAPIRMRVERQLGYKHAKYVMRIEAVESLAGVYGGKGGFWEDSSGYAWYAGI